MEIPVLEGLPQPEGICATGEAALDVAPFLPPPFKARKLHELVDEYVLFSHAALLTHGNLTIDPVIDYCEQNNIDPKDRPLLYQSQRPFFSGVDTQYEPTEGRPCWDRTLLMAPKQIWPGLFAHLRTVAAADTLRNNFFWSEPAEFAVAEDFEKPPMPVILFGVDGNFGHWQFRRYTTDPRLPITLCRCAARAETVAFAKQIFAGNSRPYRIFEHE